MAAQWRSTVLDDLPAEGAGSVAALRLRLVAYLVDFAVIGAASATEEGTRSQVAAAVVLLVVNLVCLPVRWGTTAGHAVMRLRFVPLVDGELMPEQRGVTVTTALGRALEWLCCLPLTPLVLLTVDGDRRTLVDRWTSTVVVEW